MTFQTFNVKWRYTQVSGTCVLIYGDQNTATKTNNAYYAPSANRIGDKVHVKHVSNRTTRVKKYDGSS